ncbi:MAG: hypothetical protein NTX88_02115 [Candidatus Atribacteria bacterium]|nr:hypothetical protein [Candidatus Atribacteria bacterium]
MTILRIINKLSWYFFMKMKLPISGIDNKVEDIIDNYYLIPALKEFDDKLSKGEFQIVSWDEYQKQKASALPI